VLSRRGPTQPAVVMDELATVLDR